MGYLNVSDLKASSWGSSWEPDTWDRREWPDFEERPPPDSAARPSGGAPDDWPLFEQFGERRLVLIGR